MKKEIVDKMSLQEIIDFIGSKLAEQGKRCMDTYSCAYTNGKGAHCAIGWVLDEDKEVINCPSSLYGMRADKLYLDTIPSILMKEYDLFSEIQQVHDINDYNKAKGLLGALRDEYKSLVFNHHWDVFLNSAHGIK